MMRAMFLLMLLTACGTQGAQPEALHSEQAVYDTGLAQVQVNISYRGRVQPGTCVVALHGAGYNSRYYSIKTGSSLMSTLTGAGYAFSITLSTSADALHRLSLMLRSRCSRQVFLGHSAGAAVAVRAQADYGDAVAVAVQGFSIAPYDPGVPPDVVSALLASDYAEYPAALRPQFFLTTGAQAAEVQADVYASDRVPRGLLSDVLGLFRSAAPVHAERVRVPLYVQQSSSDALYPPQPWPGAEQAAYSGAAHCFECGSAPVNAQIRTDLRAWLLRVLP